jgi:putative transposase
MNAYLGATYRLDPTPQQAAQLAGFAAACRVVWNIALEQRQTAWRRQRERVSFAGQCREIKDVRAAVPFLAKPPVDVFHAALRDLDTAFGSWFRGRTRYPNWRSAKDWQPSFRLKGNGVRVAETGRHVRIAKIGLVRAFMSRELPGRIVSATFSRRGLHWYVSFGCEVPAPIPAPHMGQPVGLDVGIANTVTLSTGEHLSMPVPSDRDWRVLARWQRRLSKRTGRRGRAGARRRISRWYERFGNVRNDFAAKTATTLCERHGLIALEDLAVARLTKRGSGKAGLNRSMLLRAFGALRTRIEQKAKWTGTMVVAVNPAYTSRTCSRCSHVARENRESQAVFRCVVCGFELHADVNAAINILSRATAGQAESHAEGAGSQEGPASNSEPYTTSTEASYVR